VAPFRGQPQAGAARVVWPLKSNLARAGKPIPSGLGYRCIAVGGKDARTLLATLRKANERSRWAARPGAKGSFELIARPLLPDERGCAATAG
jgi:hypothetical protein